MVRLTSDQLPASQLQELFRQLSHTLAKRSEKHTEHFLSELLGAEEQIMLAKRLAVIVLLIEGHSLYRISKLLKVSPTTAEKIKLNLEAYKYEHLVISLGKNKREYFSLLKTLDDILHLGGLLPHYNGPERYRSLT